MFQQKRNGQVIKPGDILQITGSTDFGFSIGQYGLLEKMVKS